MQAPNYINISVLLSDDEVDDIIQRHPSILCRAKLTAHMAVTNALLRLRKGELAELDKLKRENEVLKSEVTRLSDGGGKAVKAALPPPASKMPWAVKRDEMLTYYSTRQEARYAAMSVGGTVVDCRVK